MQRTDFIAVNEPLLDGNEKKYLTECIDTGWISSEGPFVEKFELAFSSRVGRKWGIAVCNGTAALDAAIEALGIGPGDEVILPAFTIISCIGQLIRCGARPVLVDSDARTWNMDVQQIEAKITPRTKAIMVVHTYGLPVDMDPVLMLQSVTACLYWKTRPKRMGRPIEAVLAGSLGDISTFSFYPNKLVTTGEGGMIVTNDDALAATCYSLRNLCFQAQRRFVHERLGWNLRMTNLQAALGVAQLERIDEFAARKRAMGKRYTELLSGIPGLQLPVARTDYAENIYWVYGLVLSDEVAFDAAVAMKKLAALGIGCRPFFCPMNQQPVLLERGLFNGESHPVAERMYRKGFYIPSGLALTDAQITRVAEALGSILK